MVNHLQNPNWDNATIRLSIQDCDSITQMGDVLEKPPVCHVSPFGSRSNQGDEKSAETA
jgi:hypothetical protein